MKECTPFSQDRGSINRFRLCSVYLRSNSTNQACLGDRRSAVNIDTTRVLNPIIGADSVPVGTASTHSDISGILRGLSASE